MNSNRRVLGLIGASLLVLGFFMPLVSFLGLISLSYLDLLTTVSARFITGLFVLALGGLSLALALKNSFRPLLGTGIAALLILCFDFATYKSALAGRVPAAGTGTGGERLGQFLEQAAGILIRPSWGMYLLLAGSILLIIAGAMKGSPVAPRDWRNTPPPPMSYT